MKKKVLSWKEEYLAEGGTLEGYENHLVQIEQRLRELAAKRTRPDGTVEPWPDIASDLVKELVKEEPLSIDQELRLLAGSEEAYQRMLANLGEQMAHIAKTRGRFDLKNNRFVPIEKPKPTRKPRSKGSRAEPGVPPK
jgi:hypothetical protein